MENKRKYKRKYIEEYVTAKTPEEQEIALKKLKSTDCWLMNVKGK
jgi:hypothetical protein